MPLAFLGPFGFSLCPGSAESLLLGRRVTALQDSGEEQGDRGGLSQEGSQWQSPDDCDFRNSWPDIEGIPAATAVATRRRAPPLSSGPGRDSHWAMSAGPWIAIIRRPRCLRGTGPEAASGTTLHQRGARVDYDLPFCLPAAPPSSSTSHVVNPHVFAPRIRADALLSSEAMIPAPPTSPDEPGRPLRTFPRPDGSVFAPITVEAR